MTQPNIIDLPIFIFISFNYIRCIIHYFLPVVYVIDGLLKLNTKLREMEVEYYIIICTIGDYYSGLNIAINFII